MFGELAVRRDSQGVYLPRQVRFALEERRPVEVTVCDRRGFPWYETQGQLVNLSKNGARLEVEQEIPLQGMVRIKVGVANLGLEFHVSGSVCWVRSREDYTEKREFGCALRPGVPEGLLARLANGDRDQRGLKPNGRKSMPVRVSLAEGAGDFTGELHQYSRGGFCLGSFHALTPGQSLQLHLAPPHRGALPIAGLVQWAMTADQHWLAGCAFLEPCDFERLVDASKSR